MTMTRIGRAAAGLIALLLIGQAGCASTKTASAPPPDETKVTKKDKTAKGAGIGAAAGAAIAALTGSRKADHILEGAAIGAGIGAGVGVYMDHQEEKLGHIPGTTVERVSDDTLLVHFQSDVLFDVDSAIVKPQAQDSLDDAAQVFQEYRKTAIIVQGHTDSTGTEEHNQALSERRAQSVVAYLTGKGIDPARMAPQGYGEGQPVASNDSTDGRAKNRRVDLLLKAKAK
ncbi:MAG TPA: OmpA family protein [Candidatus Polarisedimenticolia bacterium]|jgi:outer membrane protein OmpA-like peptidoglycan-associated protein|nr:OmpA family protein [Candidatus Polarisedimenticolia bacterium]